MWSTINSFILSQSVRCEKLTPGMDVYVCNSLLNSVSTFEKRLSLLFSIQEDFAFWTCVQMYLVRIETVCDGIRWLYNFSICSFITVLPFAKFSLFFSKFFRWLKDFIKFFFLTKQDFSTINSIIITKNIYIFK